MAERPDPSLPTSINGFTLIDSAIIFMIRKIRELNII